MAILGVPAQGARAAHGGFSPAQLRRAYDFLPLYRRGITGKGQSIAFIEVDGFAQTDLDAFDRTYGLPAARARVYLPSGATQDDMPPAEGETIMDLEYAHALAPAARLQVYEVLAAGDFTGYASALSDALHAAVANGASVISMSLRGTGNFFCSQLHAALQMHSVLQETADKGISIFAASGDYGASPCQTHPFDVGTVYPAADPAVTAVGGTTLSLTSSGAIRAESAWEGSGGGDTSDFSRPSWQRGPGVEGDSRGVPDVAFDADPQSGVAVLLNGKWQVVGGTSLGAPCWAALWALAAQAHQARTGHRIGWANPLLYALANSPQRTRVFHDVTSGDNGYYKAGAGWDAVTGWGSPDAAALVQALQS
jgi:kumamolisin